ncbi:hypothetical protein [Lyngbya sp. PCC 8106]|uniref:hypothetical protein n=1 Tax=Lyngbya sp. (strain PCC 8106) TaxID=313612 RepID=UPI0000EAB627|nr:hypothetical protein [Lyngbya sp. PCC 8106]EAW35967.1 hypothetical protein L8106_22266 [Lyngbya sp. PCC 8106]
MNPNNEQLLELLCRMSLDFQTFQNRWDLESQQIAKLCGLSTSTVSHWRVEGMSQREVSDHYQRIFALADLLLENTSDTLTMAQRWHQFRGV